MWGTNKSYRLVLYNLFEDCFEGKILFFAIVCISDGVFLKNMFVWEMFEGDNKKKTLLLYSTWDQTSTDQLKNEQALFFCKCW